MIELNPFKHESANVVRKTLKKFASPYMTTFNGDGDSRKKLSILQQLDALACHVFGKSNQVDSLVDMTSLIAWYEHSPESWLILEEEGKILAFAHIERIRKECGDSIRKGLSHEGNISLEDILKEDDVDSLAYIHFGCIVVAPPSFIGNRKMSRRDVIVRLLAGVVARLLELDKKGNSEVLAVSYPDAKGNLNSKALLKRFGFESWGERDSLGNEIQTLNLRKLNKRALELKFTVCASSNSSHGKPCKSEKSISSICLDYIKFWVVPVVTSLLACWWLEEHSLKVQVTGFALVLGIVATVQMILHWRRQHWLQLFYLTLGSMVILRGFVPKFWQGDFTVRLNDWKEAIGGGGFKSDGTDLVAILVGCGILVFAYFVRNDKSDGRPNDDEFRPS